jgi:hypothetical protein
LQESVLMLCIVYTVFHFKQFISFNYTQEKQMYVQTLFFITLSSFSRCSYPERLTVVNAYISFHTFFCTGPPWESNPQPWRCTHHAGVANTMLYQLSHREGFTLLYLKEGCGLSQCFPTLVLQYSQPFTISL